MFANIQAFAVEDAYLVRDILSGTGSSSPSGITVMGSHVYFSAAATGTNTELWRSDGTNAGTVLVQEIRAGNTGSGPNGFATNGTFLFFEANDGTNGMDGYVSNGNVGNFTLLNVRPGGTDAAIANPTPAGTRIYFTANDGSSGTELWSTDGATAVEVDIRAGANSSTPNALTAFGNLVVFECNNGSAGVEPYVSNGTAVGTFILANIQSGGNSSDPTEFEYVPALGVVFFDADAAGAVGRELYMTNGTAVGTVLVENLNTGGGGGNDSNPQDMVSALGKLFFSADDGSGQEPWVSDGTPAGTFELSNIQTGGTSSNPNGFTEVNGQVFFAADGSNGIELYVTDGTGAGTQLVENINAGGNDSSPSNLTAFGNLLFFTASDGSGQEPWISDGTTGGTFELRDIRAGATGSSVGNIVVTTDFVYFTADDNGTNGVEWWRTDGTTAGTIVVHNINAGGNDSNPSSAVLLGNTVLSAANSGTTGGGTGTELWGIETIHPSVVSIVKASADPTGAAQVNFTVTFSEGVTGVNAGDFVITAPGLSGTSVASVTQVNSSTYTVTVNTGTGAGSLRLDIDDNDSIVDLGLSANPIGGEGANNGDYTAGEFYTVDRLAPTVSSINRADANPTNASSVAFTVQFSEDVSGVNAADFSLTTTGLTGTSLGTITQNTANNYTVNVNVGTGTGTLRLDVTDNDSIIDGWTNPLGGAGAGNGNFTTGQVYTIDRTAPSVSSIVRADANPTSSPSVDFTVTFNETVTGVNAGDFTLTLAGVTGASVASVTPVSGTVYTVAVNTGTGNGTIRLDVADDDSIADSAGNALGGTGAGNGNFTSGQSYTVDISPPFVVSIVRNGGSPTNAASVSYTVTFNENVTGVGNGDFTLTTSGVSGASVSGTAQVTPSTYTLTVNTGSGSGTIRLDLSDNDSIRDTLNTPLGGTGNGNGDFTTGEVYTIDKTAPAVSSIARAGSDPTSSATVSFTVTFTENVTGVNNGDFSLTTSGVTGTSVASTTQVTPSTYTVTVNTGSGSGTIRLNFVDNNSVTDGVGNATAVGFTTGEVYTIDRTGPTVSSINRVGTNPTGAASLDYLVTFNENVTGVDSGDFSLTNTGTIAGTSITGVVQTTASTYTVTVNSGTGEGTIRVNFIDNDSVADTLGNVAGGAGAGNANFTTGQTYTIDRTPPAVSSINRADGNPTNSTSVDFTVTFDETVTGVNTADFTLNVTGLTGSSVTSVTPVSGTVYTVAVNTGSGSGTLRLDLADDDSIDDSAGNPLGGTGAGNGSFTSGQQYTVDRENPFVVSIVRASANPTNAGSVQFTVTFNENVTGVSSPDFDVTSTGLGGTPAVTGTTQVTPSTYTVTVSTGSGSGTLRLDLDDNDSIRDSLNNRLGGIGNNNGDFNGGEVYTIDRTAPAVSSIVRADANPTGAASVNFTVTFSENVTGVNNGDFTLNVSGITGAAVTSTTQVTASTYTVAVSTGTGSGTIRLDFVDNNSVTDSVGNATATGFTSGQSYNVDRTGPDVSSINRASGNPTNAAVVNFTVTFDENATGVDAADFSVNMSGGVTGASVGTVTQNTPTNYTVSVNTGSNSGTIRLDFIDNDTVLDSFGNPSGGTGAGNGNFTSGQTYTMDRVGPAVDSISRFSANPTNNNNVTYLVTFDEDVNGLDVSDFTLTTTGTLTGASVTAVTDIFGLLFVTVNTGTGSGDLRLDFIDNDTVTDDLGNPSGGTGNGNGNFTTGDTYTIDRTTPSVSSIVRANSDPTNNASVNFTVTFNEDVTGVGTADFVLTTTGVTGTSITSVTQVTPDVYTVAVNTGSGSGTIRLDVVDDDSIRDQVNNRLGGTGNGNGNFNTGQFYTIDRIAPTVSSINRTGGNPSGAATIQFTATFSEAVTGVDTSDFTLNTSGVTGASVASVTQVTQSTYTVTVNTGSGSGTIRLNLTDDDSIRDLATNRLGGTGAGNGNFTGQQYTIDKTLPAVTSITRVDANPTGASSVNYLVTFSEDVSGVDAADFVLTATGTVAGTSVTTVTQNTASTYNVLVNTGTGDGTLQLDFTDDDSVVDTAANPTGGAGAGNGNFTGGEAYTLDRTVPVVVSIVRANANPTNATSVDFTVAFSEDVTGVNVADFALTTTGVTGASITSRTQITPSTYTVTVNTGSGDGTVRLDLIDNDSIQDGVNNSLGGPGAVNGDFTAGEVYTVDRTAPTVTSIVRAGSNPTGATSVQFTVTFSEDVTGVNAGDFTLTTTGVTGASITSRTQITPSTYTVNVNTGTGSGTIRLDLDDNDSIVDSAANALGGTGNGNGNFTTGEVYDVDKTLPNVSSIVRVDANPTSASTVRFDVTFTENVTGVDVSDFVVTTTGISGASVDSLSLQVSSSVYRVTVNTGTGDGTVRLDLVDDDSILDASSNPVGGTGAGNGDYTTGEVYNVDKSMPAVVSVVRANASPSNAASVDFAVTFSESVTGVNTGDFDLATTGLTGAAIVSRTQVTPSVYTVTVNTGSGSGTIRLDVDDNDSIRDLFNNPLGGPGSNNGTFTTGEVYTIDRTPPSVVSSVRANGNPTNLASVDFTVTFNESVTGVDESDFTLSTTGVIGASITSRTQVTPAQYTVTVNTGTGNGTIRLNVVDNDSIVDVLSSPLGGTGTGNGSFNTGETYTVDKVNPTVTSITRVNATPTSASSVEYSVTFSENVIGLVESDFAITASGVTGASVSNVFQVTPSQYTITVVTGIGTGTIRLDLVDDDSVTDPAGNPLGGTGAGNGSFTTGDVYTIDTAAPFVQSIVRGIANPTGSSIVNFTVTFNENVTGVNVGDFALTTTGLTGANITTRTQVTPNVYTIVVQTGSGSGTLRLDLIDNDSIVDGLNNPLGGVGAGNGDFTNGEVFDIDRTDPTVVSVARNDLNPTAQTSVAYTVTFSESVTGFTIADLSLFTTGLSGVSIQSVVPVSGSEYTVNVNTGTGDGTIRVDVVDDNSVADALGNELGGDVEGDGDFLTGELYNVVRSVPLVNAIARVSSNPSNGAQVTYSVRFTMDVTGVGMDDFTLTTTGLTGASVAGVSQVNGAEYTVNVNTGTGDGTLKLNLIDNDTIMDGLSRRLGGTGAGNGNYTTGETFGIDKAAPTIAISGPSLGTTFTGPVDYTVTFTGADNVALNAGMVTLNTTGTATGSVSISGTGNVTRIVTVSNTSGAGTIGISIAAGAATDSATNPTPAAGPSATFDVLDLQAVPVNPWIVLVTMLFVAGVWAAFRRKRAM
ncbi:MAG: hypothetical protein IT366_16615 [Candidatus Hydrogenedentes bacterium]|nr:hypothetical protein [Candidatus Hydrogenedentota bacterium]